MKKSLFGYKVSEVNVTLSTLREENESLNATIATLKTQMKNGANGNGAKISLLEADLKKSEEELIRVNEEKNELLSTISSLTTELEALKQEHKITLYSVSNKAEEAQASEEELSAVIDPAIEVKASPVSSLAIPTDDPSRVALKDYSQLQDELQHIRKELESTSALLESKNLELARAKEELSYTKDALATTKISLETTTEQLEQFKKPLDINKASEISFQAYYEMSRMRNVIVEYMQQQMREYYQLVNESNMQLRSVIEQRQQEYNHMIREFFSNASDFRTKLSNMEVEVNKLDAFNLNIDHISTLIKESMDKFMDECEASLRNT